MIQVDPSAMPYPSNFDCGLPLSHSSFRQPAKNAAMTLSLTVDEIAFLEDEAGRRSEQAQRLINKWEVLDSVINNYTEGRYNIDINDVLLMRQNSAADAHATRVSGQRWPMKVSPDALEVISRLEHTGGRRLLLIHAAIARAYQASQDPTEQYIVDFCVKHGITRREYLNKLAAAHAKAAAPVAA